MSVTSAMFTGVTGLLANAEGINVIGNNLANVNTIGFKSGRMLFSDMLSVNIGNSSQIGRGTQIQKVDNIFSQGSFENTELVTDLAIQGNSFFALKTPAQASLTAQNQATLTRAGAFRLDSSKFLVNPDGYQVVDTAGNAIQFTDNAAAIATTLGALTPAITASSATMTAATVPAMYVTPATDAATAATAALTAAQNALTAAQTASTAATASGNATAIGSAAQALADANAAVAAAQNAVTLATTATTNAASATTAASTLGTATGNLSANQNDTTATAASVANTTAGNSLRAANTSLNAMSGALAAVGAALTTAGTSLTTVGTDLTAAGDAAGGTAATTAAGAATTAAGTATTAGTAVDTAMTAQVATYDAANTAATAADTAYTTYHAAAAAAFSKITKVDSDGLITYVGKFGDTFYYSATNAIGIPTSTATAAQIAAAQRIAVINPANPGGMDKLGGTLFQISATSGVPTTGFSISDNKINGTSEKIFSNSLEQSNVDMAGQFVKMILTQRAYSANSKTITTADEMTQEVLNLKR